jgi:DNA-binding response OmpR family regulator
MTEKRVLIAEDDETILLLEKKILEGAGYRVDCATTGVMALELVKQNRYTLVVADVMMPEMDGFTLTREIEKLYKKSVPVLLVTAVHDALKAAHDRDVKPMSTLQKPFTSAALLTAVKMLEGQAAKAGMDATPKKAPPKKAPQKSPPQKKPSPKKGWLEKLISK